MLTLIFITPLLIRLSLFFLGENRKYDQLIKEEANAIVEGYKQKLILKYNNADNMGQ